jgi:hypothetical protein
VAKRSEKPGIDNDSAAPPASRAAAKPQKAVRRSKVNDVVRIHPAIGVARVGNSEEYFIAPETMAASQDGSAVTGGLPIRAKTDKEPIRDTDLRDSRGALKRQAARFRIFAYPSVTKESWPRGEGTEVVIGSHIGDRVVADIIWSVHVANKKANTFELAEEGAQGISSYTDQSLPRIRNPHIGEPKTDPNTLTPTEKIKFLNAQSRIRKLTIDPGPRTIQGKGSAPVRFDKATTASYYDAGRSEVVALKNYPKSFPGDCFPHMDCPAGPIDTLGELQTDEHGRLLVLGGYGRAAGWQVNGSVPLNQDVNNDQWFDDTSDGPVSATVVFDDDSRAEVQGAWVTTTDPAYAPQIRNIVTCWDDIYDCWVREHGLAPDVYDGKKGGYQNSYQPTFEDQIAPIFRSSALQRWTTNVSDRGAAAHQRIAEITAQDNPLSTDLAGLTPIFRDPFDPDHKNTTQMPLHLGDANDAFLTLRKTQHFFLQQWSKGVGHFRPDSGKQLGEGEKLDKTALVNCLGGRFSPGIDFTFIIRETNIFIPKWQTSGKGPFRIWATSLNYAAADNATTPLLTAGYVPRHVEHGLEPGDLSKFMAVPWHTDYNSCATHLPDPNPPGNRTLIWSWPTQRPVAVYAATDISRSEPPGQGPVYELGAQRWSIRGDGTDAIDPENWGRYQDRHDMLDNWHRIGVVMQATAIDSQPLLQEANGQAQVKDWYLEAGSHLDDTGNTPVVPFPNLASTTDLDHPNASQLDPRDLFYKLMNVSDHQDVLVNARAYVDFWLAEAEKFSNNPQNCPADHRFFRFTQQAFQDRLDRTYQELVDEAADSDPGADKQIFRTREDMITRIIQWAPFNLTDGSWLRNIGRTGPMDDVRGMLYSILMDELGDGDIAQNHCNIYRDLCHSVGYYPLPVESRAFAFDPQFLVTAFHIPAFQLAISQFTEDYYPEIIGMTLFLEWEVVQLKPTRDLMTHFELDPHFYVMHIGIDNAANGHGRRAADAVSLFLDNIRLIGGEKAVQATWRRIWNGFVAFFGIPFDVPDIPTFAEDLMGLITKKRTLRDQLIEMIERKAAFGSRNHQQLTLGENRIDQMFADPPAFLDALKTYGWITPGDWTHSRLNELTQFETGPMIRVFSDDEIALWAAYTESLAVAESTSKPDDCTPARGMAALIKQLKPMQHGVAGHRTNMLADPDSGEIHRLSWWFDQPDPRKLMAALASPINEMITPRRPEDSPFYTKLIAPAGPMGDIFSLPAQPPNTGTCRDVVHRWISEGAPVIAEELSTLRLSSPPAKRDIHPTGRIYGMGGIH